MINDNNNSSTGGLVIKKNLPIPHGAVSDLYRTVLKLCAEGGSDFSVKKFDIMLECESLDLDGKSVDLIFQNLLDIGYIHEVKPDTYSIFSKEAYEEFHEIRRDTRKLFAKSASQN